MSIVHLYGYGTFSYELRCGLAPRVSISYMGMERKAPRDESHLVVYQSPIWVWNDNNFKTPTYYVRYQSPIWVWNP